MIRGPFLTLRHAGLSMALGVCLALSPASAADPRLAPPLVQLSATVPASAQERSFTGVISARVQSNLGFRVPGKVIARLVDQGQEVRAGQPLLRLDPKDLGLAAAARENSVAAARALAVQATADEARYRELLASGWATRQRYDQAKSAKDSALAQLAAAQAQSDLSRNEAEYATLIADADGVIVETLAEPGQVVQAGQTVIRLAQAGAREATVALPETLRPAIGSPATAKPFGSSQPPSPARLRQLSHAADPVSRTFEARYALEGAAAEAPLGATITLRIRSTDAADGMLAPLGALFDNGAATGVWVYDPSTETVSFRTVQVRRLLAESAVVEGLKPGEKVVALGAHLLRAGDKARVGAERAVQ